MIISDIIDKKVQTILAKHNHFENSIIHNKILDKKYIIEVRVLFINKIKHRFL